MKISSALYRLITPLSSKTFAAGTGKTASVRSQKLFFNKTHRKEFPCMPWLSSDLLTLKWSTLQKAHRRGELRKRSCTDKERAMLALVKKALICNKNIELMMVSFTKG